MGMVLFDVDKQKNVIGFANQSMTGTTAVSTAAINRQGYSSALIFVDNSAGTSGTLTLTFVEGATSSPVTPVALNATPAVINAATAQSNMYTVDLSGFNQYFEVTVTPALGANTSLVGCHIVLVDAILHPGAGTGNAVTPIAKA
jgi:hypothetical protein